MCIEQMGERIDTLEANLAAAHAATAAERAATATVKFDLAAVQADMAAVRADEDAARAEARAALPLFDIERWPGAASASPVASPMLGRKCYASATKLVVRRSRP